MVPAARGAYVQAHSRFQLSVVYTCGPVRGATLGDFGGTILPVVCACVSAAYPHVVWFEQWLGACK